MAGVKSMLNKFEQVDNMDARKVIKPTTAAKPSLQRLQQAKENATNTSSQSSPASAPNCPPKPVKLPGFSGTIPSLKPVATNNNNNTNDKGGLINVPKAFQNGTGSKTSSDNNNNNNNNDQSQSIKNVWSRKSSSSSSSNESTQPSAMPKFPSMSVSNHSLINHSSKPPFSSQKPDTENSLEKNNSKKALLPKGLNSQSSSIKSNSSNTSSVSSSSSSSASSSSSNPVTNVSSPASPSPNSPSSTNGVFDFRSQLRKVSPGSYAPPGKRVLSDVSSDSLPSDSPATKTPASVSSSDASTASSTDSEAVEKQSRVPPLPSRENVQMRSKPTQDEENILIRKSDGKRFKKIEPPEGKPPPTPKKPAKPTNIDLKFIRQQYDSLKKGLDISNDGPSEPEVPEAEEDVYAEGMTLQDAPLPPLTPPKKQLQTSRESQRISLIPEMSPEEEEEDLPLYDETPMEDIYDDAMSDIPAARNPKMSVSSETPSETEQEKKKRLKEEANAKKREEKERREKEKKEKEEEKRRKKKEEEETRQRSKFNLTGNEKVVGEGVIKQDARASGLNLKVKKGQIIDIIRLDLNPPNKWLIKADGQLGYVESQNIEVDPNIIRKAIEAQVQGEDLDQPTYDDVPDEKGPSNNLLIEDEEDDEEIYEFCE